MPIGHGEHCLSWQQDLQAAAVVGGSTTAETSSPSTPSTPASSPSTTPTAPTGPAPTTTIAAASYAASSVEAGVYNGINQIRQAGKWGTLTQDALLDKAGRNMAD